MGPAGQGAYKIVSSAQQDSKPEQELVLPSVASSNDEILEQKPQVERQLSKYNERKEISSPSLSVAASVLPVQSAFCQSSLRAPLPAVPANCYPTLLTRRTPFPEMSGKIQSSQNYARYAVYR